MGQGIHQIKNPLKKWREAAHMTQAQMGERLGKKQDTISKWESAKRIDPEKISLYAAVLGGTPEIILVKP